MVDGVPRFADGGSYAASFGRQWNRWREVQLDSRNDTTLFRERFRRYVTDPERLRGMTVLDAGCGAGAFLDVVAPYAAEVVGFDLSDAVFAAAKNLGGSSNVCVVQGDIFTPPVAADSFDVVFSIGVLQHTPDPHAAFQSLARCVKPGGLLAVWIYERKPWEALKPKHLLRRATRRLDPDQAMRFADRYAPRALRLRHGLKVLPGGRVLSRLVPVADLADYPGDPLEQLTPEQAREWTVMDTHDILVSWHEHPQRPATVANWFAEAGFHSVRRAGAEHVAMTGIRRA